MTRFISILVAGWLLPLVVQGHSNYRCQVFVDPLSRKSWERVQVTVFQDDAPFLLGQIQTLPTIRLASGTKRAAEALRNTLSKVLGDRQLTVAQIAQTFHAASALNLSNQKISFDPSPLPVGERWHESRFHGTSDLTPMQLNSGEVALLYARRAGLNLDQLAAAANLETGPLERIHLRLEIAEEIQEAVARALKINSLEFLWTQFLTPGERLFFHRLRQSMPVDVLSERSGIDIKIIQAIEQRDKKRVHNVTVAEREQLAAALRISADELGLPLYDESWLYEQVKGRLSSSPLLANIGPILRDFRTRNTPFSINVLASALRITPETLIAAERGRSQKIDFLRRWMFALGLDEARMLELISSSSETNR